MLDEEFDELLCCETGELDRELFLERLRGDELADLSPRRASEART
jgi:hypothetical protein